MKYIKLTIALNMLCLFCACEDFISLDSPVEQLDTRKVYSTDQTALAAINGLYAKLSNGVGFASGYFNSVTLFAGRSADDFVNLSTNEEKKQFSENNLSARNQGLRSGLWQEPYQIIYAANMVIENLSQAEQLNPILKKQLEGEAKFIRAFCHFYLVNLFGEIPLILTTDYKINLKAGRSGRQVIYEQIIKDLIEAKALLNNDYPVSERIRANKWAASALLSRVYLYHHNWYAAEQEASLIIAQQRIYSLENDLDRVFLNESKEAILQFALPSLYPHSTNEGLLYIIDAPPTSESEVMLSKELLDAFESGDKRNANWVGTLTSGTTSWHYPFKYKIKSGAAVLNEYSMVIRLAELYLIRAEARINQNKIEEGIADINLLRTRARPLPTADIPNPIPALTFRLSKTEALFAVEKERRTELFAEWGHRWLDLKRTRRAEILLSVTKPIYWQPTDTLYPIPESELLNAPNLYQNNGYQ
ncbi:RagB/SusD family nutrient uptake outer membrane protein [Pedobacter nyackensis]|uniref:RagB/SusD family nutrient uptake outer membrane protein n=1 Tax=Pedobacter nyackensis TaxID=475255 RepID=UPI0029314EAB|nr:RagB/SusD family nutrient uptake outer membrane protein [Pedobacter nyackensis]